MGRKKDIAVVLLSGGLDSATVLYLAKRKYKKCHCLIFDYGQRHKKEIHAAKQIAKKAGCKGQVIKIKLPWKGSSLLEEKLSLRYTRSSKTIPSTYVPARNTIFLSFALSYAEAIGAQAIFIAAHSQDYPGYPDCRPNYYRLFNLLSKYGTKSGIEEKPIKILTPLINKTKAQIIRLGMKLKVPYELTWSCYRGARLPCGKCASCFYRQRGFDEAGIKDPALK